MMRMEEIEYVQKLTLREKFCYLLIGQVEGTELTDAFADYMRKYPLSGYRVNQENVVNKTQLQTLTSSIQQMNQERGDRFPVLLACDQETGVMNVMGNLCTLFPGMMSLGATDDATFTRQQAHVIAWELNQLGCNFILAPVADVNLEHQNPVIGVRSFGDRPELVTEHCIQFIRGAHEGGIVCCAKHFPGHGNTKTDTHIGLAVNQSSFETFEQVELMPFRGTIAEDVDSIMVSHVIVNEYGYLPSTMSKEIMTDLLRKRLGYDGVIASDDLAMNAIRQTWSAGEAFVHFLIAGGDLALLNDGRESIVGAVEAGLEAVQNGLLTEERVNQSVSRVLKLKQRILHYNKTSKIPDIDGACLAQQICEQAITLIRDPKQLLPLNIQKRYLVVVPELMNLSEADTSAFETLSLVLQLQKCGFSVDCKEFSLTEEVDWRSNIAEFVPKYDVVIFAMLNGLRFPQQIELVNELNFYQPVVVILLRDPYEVKVLAGDLTVISCYSMIDVTMSVLVQQLIGKVSFQGKLPVRLSSGVERSEDE